MRANLNIPKGKSEVVNQRTDNIIQKKEKPKIRSS